MKYKMLKTSVFVIIIASLIISCDENKLEPIENNKIAPDPVENVMVENLPGKSKLTYTLPKDQDLLYVKAEYTLATGRKMEVKSSYYNNSLLVEGFLNEEEQTVKLYAVNRSEAISEPTIVTVNPKESPAWDVFRSLLIETTFGGVSIKATNNLRYDLSILLMEKNDQGDWVINDKSIYTSTDIIKKTIRPFTIEPHDFAFTVRDRWLNTTDTLYTTITPLLETPLPKSGYKPYRLPGDTKTHSTAIETGMWDGEIMNWPKVFLTDGSVAGPHTVTIDTGVLAKMSRIVIWDYPEYFNGRSYYYKGNLKEFEVWGSETPNPDGSLDQTWIKLGAYNAVKPSGLPFGQQTDEDYQTANAGFSWEFEPTAPKVRYLRIKSLKNWGATGSMSIGEIQVYGNTN
ncbi:DUF5000 domain-containing lipoprotein [Mariniflexile litorale]|uniref:DUF5000 domain-containing lipoprotein n=1 Tax=Mariniflexile litorale TaxID=3045158 RepID=A0AAU7EFL2_9FLAO|nr:DUF5000 domain-containing lipoprotein [Mariniflexile sp. KMM 9835]MDQ8210683.1 DUF5000 domain-containing lipoprotein [Mariniflexile sp. KMM 9835]